MDENRRTGIGRGKVPDTGPAVVWRLRIRHGEAERSSLLSLLSDTERRRAEHLRTTAARDRFVATRAGLRILLAERTGVPPAALQLVLGPTGKPSLHPDHGEHPHFSVSHAGDLALIALCEHGPVGIDVERIRATPRIARIAARLFDPPTNRLLGTLPAGERLLAFHHAWTQREAFVKAVGGRVFATHDPLSFRWPRPAGPDIQDDGMGGSWTVGALEIEEGYAATVVATGIARNIRLLDLRPESLQVEPSDPDRR